MKYEYISYDLWGNEEDGYQVNQSFRTGEFVEIDPSLNDLELLNQLADQDFINDDVDYALISITGEAEYALYFEYGGRPEFELHPAD